MKTIPELDWRRIDLLIALALEEDLQERGDVTTKAVIGENMRVKAVFLAKEDCVCAGLPVAKRIMKEVDPEIEWKDLVQEGEFCPKGTLMAEITGRAASILTAERTALNFLQRLSGVATASKKYQDAAAGTNAVILDTRKTTPGWRNLEKYAVAVGGASNHRIGLFDRVMIKDNHRELAAMEGPGSIARSVNRVREQFPGLEVEVEADRLEEVAEAADAGAEYILLDNMSNEMMAEAVKIVHGRSKLEASGGITLTRLASIGQIGVDFVSSGALTHSVKSADISLDIIAEASL